MKRNNEESNEKDDNETSMGNCRYLFYPHLHASDTEWYISPKVGELTENDKRIIDTLVKSYHQYLSNGNGKPPSKNCLTLTEKCLQLIRRKLKVAEYEGSDDDDDDDEDGDEEVTGNNDDSRNNRSDILSLFPKVATIEAENLGSNWLYLNPDFDQIEFTNKLSEVSKSYHLILNPIF